MTRQRSVSLAGKLTVVGLVVAAGGVVIQMLSGVAYPTIPPVFFIVLIPAALIAFGRWFWTPVTAVLAGLFLTFGLFASGASVRLFDLTQRGGVGGSIGLWIQMLGVIAAAVVGVAATIQNYSARTVAIEMSPVSE